MGHHEGHLIALLKNNGVDFTASLPCEKVKVLLEEIALSFFHVPLTREEEGVGICAGAALSGKRPALFVQSSGIGNMMNALLSLTAFYELPLAVFVSQRGIYKEKIAAQLAMGKRLPGILRGAGISYSTISTSRDMGLIERNLPVVYRKNAVHVFLLSPAIWEGTRALVTDTRCGIDDQRTAPRGARPFTPLSSPLPRGELKNGQEKRIRPRFTRYEILEAIAPLLNSKAVVANLGFPAKELYAIKHQPSNFYMLGSMGMVTPIGLGIALTSDSQVVVIEGDGSILMNPGTLATSASCNPGNLTILAIDNGAYGSTGNQPTLTSTCVDLEAVARGFGIVKTAKVAGKGELIDLMKKRRDGLTFIHSLALPGNRDVPNIPLHHLENKRQVQEFLRSEISPVN